MSACGCPVGIFLMDLIDSNLYLDLAPETIRLFGSDKIVVFMTTYSNQSET